MVKSLSVNLCSRVSKPRTQSLSYIYAQFIGVYTIPAVRIYIDVIIYGLFLLTA